jgi:putative ABC transport system permease protein
MKTRDIFSYSFSAIKLRKLRASLTILGVVIGIAAIVALLSVSTGLQTTIQGQLEKGLSADTLIVVPGAGALGSQGSGGFGGGAGGGGGGGFGGQGASSSNIPLYINYTTQIDNLSSDIVSSIAIVNQPGNITDGSYSRPIGGGITGVNFTEYANIYSTTFVAASGNIPLNPTEDQIVIGARINDPRLNGSSFVNVGDAVTISWPNSTQIPITSSNYTATVAAVLDKIGGFSVGGPSDTGVYVPITKAASFFGTDQASEIVVKLKNSDNATITSVSKLITDYFGNQVSVISSTAVLSLVSTIFNTITIFLAGIAAISLLVAGIGIMNIMIVSLIERTREIGILKALGMKSRTVLGIFLCESIIIGLIGAVVGIVLGWGLANIVARVFGRGGLIGGAGGGGGAVLSITPILSPEVFALALGFGIGVSVIFALYPAWRASKLKPVDALRYE